MKKLQNKKGFTLIELLVVITIIGILATGWVAVFTKQLQGARDTTRINNLKLLETSVNQHFSDNSEYPSDTVWVASVAVTWSGFKTRVSWYMSKYPADPKPGQNICWTPTATAANWDCWVWYQVWNDSNSLRKAAYKLALSFEKLENASGSSSPANTDGWVNQLSWYLEVFGWVGGANFLTGTTSTGITVNTANWITKLY